MPSTVNIDKINININSETSETLEVLHEAFTINGIDVEDAKIAGALTTSKDNYRNQSGFWALMIRPIETWADIKAGGRVATLGAISVECDPPAHKLLSSYIERLNTVLEESGIYATDTEVKDINHKMVLVYHIIIRLVTFSLSIEAREDGIRIINVLTHFLKKLSMKNYFDSQSMFFSKTLTPFGRFISHEHMDWIASLKNTVTAVSMLHANDTTLKSLLTHLNNTNQYLKAQFVAYVLPSLKDVDFGQYRLDSSVTKAGKYILDGTNQMLLEAHQKRLANGEESTLALIESPVEIYHPRDGHVTLPVIEYLEKRYDKKNSAKITRLIEALKKNNDVIKLFDALDSLNTMTAWVWIILGIVNIDEVRKIIRHHTEEIVDVLHIPRDDDFFKSTSGNSLGRLHLTAPADLINSAEDCAAKLAVLDDKFTMRFLGSYLSQAINTLQITSDQLGYNIINHRQLENAAYSLHRQTEVNQRSANHYGYGNVNQELVEFSSPPLLLTDIDDAISTPNSIYNKRPFAAFHNGDELLLEKIPAIATSIYGELFKALPKENQQVALENIAPIIKRQVLLSLHMLLTETLYKQYQLAKHSNSAELKLKKMVGALLVSTETGNYHLAGSKYRLIHIDELHTFSTDQLLNVLQDLNKQKTTSLKNALLDSILNQELDTICESITEEQLCPEYPLFETRTIYKPEANTATEYGELSTRLSRDTYEKIIGKVTHPSSRIALPFIAERCDALLKQRLLDFFNEGTYLYIFNDELSRTSHELECPEELSKEQTLAYHYFMYLFHDNFDRQHYLIMDDETRLGSIKHLINQWPTNKLIQLLNNYIHLCQTDWEASPHLAENELHYQTGKLHPKLQHFIEILSNHGLLVDCINYHFEQGEQNFLLAPTLTKDCVGVLTPQVLQLIGEYRYQQTHHSIMNDDLVFFRDNENKSYAFESLAKIVYDWASKLNTSDIYLHSYTDHFIDYHFLPRNHANQRTLQEFKTWIIETGDEAQCIGNIAQALRSRAIHKIFDNQLRYKLIYHDLYVNRLINLFKIYQSQRKLNSPFLAQSCIRHEFIKIQNMPTSLRDYGHFTQLIEIIQNMLQLIHSTPGKRAKYWQQALKEIDLAPFSPSIQQKIQNKWLDPFKYCELHDMNSLWHGIKEDIYIHHHIATWWEKTGRLQYANIVTQRNNTSDGNINQWGSDLELGAAISDLPITLMLCEEEKTYCLGEHYGAVFQATSIDISGLPAHVTKWLLKLDLLTFPAQTQIEDHPPAYPFGLYIKHPVEVIKQKIREQRDKIPFVKPTMDELLDIVNRWPVTVRYYIKHENNHFSYIGLHPPHSSILAKLDTNKIWIRDAIDRYLAQAEARNLSKRLSTRAFFSLNASGSYTVGDVIAYAFSGTGAWRSGASDFRSLKAHFADCIADLIGSPQCGGHWNENRFREIAKAFIFHEIGFMQHMRDYPALRHYIDEVTDKAMALASCKIKHSERLDTYQAITKSRDMIDAILQLKIFDQSLADCLSHHVPEELIMEELQKRYSIEEMNLQHMDGKLFSVIFRTRTGIFQKYPPDSARRLKPACNKL